MTAHMLSTVAALLTPGKGILAADESLPTIKKRFAALDIASTEDTRRDYRNMLFTTPGLHESISGVILFDETIRQHTDDDIPFPEFLRRQGMVTGIKVDTGTIPFPGHADEKITQGLEGLPERLADYWKRGARFTKWRAVIRIGEGLPTADCIDVNARVLARFAALSQEAGLVPIVEPEVLMDGDHTLARCEKITIAVLERVFSALADHHVVLEAMLLKTAMVMPGKDALESADDDMVAMATLRCLRHAVPAAVPGIVFLSGGQNDMAATARLSAICRAGPVPWTLSFSYGRALQDAALKTWRGDQSNVEAAQAELRERALSNSLAIQATPVPAMESVSP